MSKKEKIEFFAILAGSLALAGIVTWFNYRPNLGFFTHASTFFFVMSVPYFFLAANLLFHRLRGFGDVHRRALRMQEETFEAGKQMGGSAKSYGQEVGQEMSRRHGDNVEIKKAFLPYLVMCLVSVVLAVVFAVLS